jgi:hypothetical protein
MPETKILNPAYDFRGQAAVVTGAGSGMGLDTARAFAVAGAAVVLVDINEDALRAATDGLAAAGHEALAVSCDVSDEPQVAALVERTVDTFDRLDSDLVFYYDSDAPYFGGIVRIGEFDGNMDALERQSADFSATIERAE